MSKKLFENLERIAGGEIKKLDGIGNNNLTLVSKIEEEQLWELNFKFESKHVNVDTFIIVNLKERRAIVTEEDLPSLVFYTDLLLETYKI